VTGVYPALIEDKVWQDPLGLKWRRHCRGFHGMLFAREYDRRRRNNPFPDGKSGMGVMRP